MEILKRDLLEPVYVEINRLKEELSLLKSQRP